MDISKAKSAIDIIDIISQHVTLRKQGRDYAGLCPFHTEKTPSFTVSPAKQMYHCFGCGAGGDVIDFARHITGYEFADACRYLGIDLDDGVEIKPARRIKHRKEHEARQRHRERQERIERQVQTWAWWYEGTIVAILEKLDDILPGIAPDELDAFAWLIDKKAIWQHHLTVITTGTEADWYELWAEQTRR